MTSKAKTLVVPLAAAMALMTGIAAAATTSVTITSPYEGQKISKSRTQYMVPAGKVTFAAPTAGSTKFYLRRDGCGSSNDNPHLSLTSGTDGGDNCGFIGGSGFLSGASKQLFSVDFPSIDGMPLTLDSSRQITGVLDLVNDVAGTGQVTLDFTAEALVNGDGIVVGTDTENVLVTPLQSEYPVSFTITPSALLDKVDLSGIDLNVYAHGAYSDSGYIGLSGRSTMTVPSWSASFKRSVLLSVDDTTFASPTTATLNSTLTGWYVAIPTPAIGQHTLYAESTQGFDTSAVATRHFTVTK